VTPYDLVGCYKPTNFGKDGGCTFLPNADTYLTKHHVVITKEKIRIFYSPYDSHLFPFLWAKLNGRMTMKMKT
jgi:hypothetical protein